MGSFTYISWWLICAMLKLKCKLQLFHFQINRFYKDILPWNGDIDFADISLHYRKWYFHRLKCFIQSLKKQNDLSFSFKIDQIASQQNIPFVELSKDLEFIILEKDLNTFFTLKNPCFVTLCCVSSLLNSSSVINNITPEFKN